MRKRLTALMLALCVFAGVFLGVPAAQAESYPVYVVANAMAVYQQPDASSKAIAALGFGANLTCTAVNGSWAQVRSDSGATGFCALSSLSVSNPNTLNIAVSISAANTPVYLLPSTSIAPSMRLPKGGAYTAVAITRDNLWVRLKNGNYYGYVEAKYLTLSSAGAASDSTDSTSTDLSGTVYCVVTALPIYAGATASSQLIGYLYCGQSINCISVTGGWARIGTAKASAYCQVSGLSKANPNTLSQTVYINTDYAPIYKAPSTDTAIWMRLRANMSFTAVAVTPDGEWTRLQNGNYFGYIETKYISVAASDAN